jgi:OmpA-OmpF porin, OOP family
MKSQLLTLFLTAFCISIFAQNTEGGQPNLVPNPSFEEFDGFPIGWYYRGTDFDDVIKYWQSPTTASPDAYGKKVRVPASWAEKGFGKQTAHTGSGFAGITLYGCLNGKPHCREYVQIQLKEPLVVGQKYTLEFWFSHLPASLRINNVGAHFAEKPQKVVGDVRLNLLPQVKSSRIIEAKNNGWTRYSAQFTAQNEAEWLIIGNFNDDETTNTQAPPIAEPLNFAYYYLDDVGLSKAEPLMPVPIKDDDLTRVPLEVGKTIVLKNIYFDSDKSDLLPRSNVELNKLLQIMRDNPKLEIEIIGHTDNLGGEFYNLDLSRRRAMMVLTFLAQNGIEQKRMRSTGFGASRPIASNDNEETRLRNRRVEFKILKK